MTDEEWADLAQRALAQAEAVDCTLAEFRDGLKVMLGEVKMRLDQVDDELDAADELEEHIDDE